MSDVLRSKLSAVRRKSVMVNAGAGAFMAGGAVIAALGVGMLVDWLWELPWTLRAALLAIDLAMLVTLIVREIVWPVLKTPDDDEVALWVEHDSPGLRSRLISAIQLTRPEAIPAGGSVSLVRALVRETEEITAPMDFMGVVKIDKIAKFGGLAALAVVLGTFGMAYGGQSSVSLLERAMLIPGVDVPRKTRVQVLTPSPLIIARGEGLELRAQASGIIPSEGSAVITYDNDKRPVQMKMSADADHRGQFALRMDTVPDSFTYRVVLNDGHSVDCRVEATVRPGAASVEIRQIFPAYTQLPPVKRSPGDLRILAGSRLAIHVTANKPVKITSGKEKPFNRISLHTKTTSIDFPLIADAKDRKMLSVQDPNTNASDIPIALDVDGLSVHLVDDNGLETKDPAVYHIEIIPDAPPAVRVTFPDRKEQLSTAQAMLIVGVEATDDFALGKLRLRYKVIAPEVAEAMSDQAVNAAPPPAGAPGAPLFEPGPAGQNPKASPANEGGETIQFDLKGTPKEFRGKFNFELNKLKIVPLEHGAVEWWLEAEDTNTVTGPGKASSDHYLARIGTEAEVRTDLFTRLGNHMGQIKETAENLKQDNADLGEMIQEKVGSK